MSETETEDDMLCSDCETELFGVELAEGLCGPCAHQKEIAALTQRAEQAEAKLRRYESAETADAKVMVAAFNKPTAAESELKRLRESLAELDDCCLSLLLQPMNRDYEQDAREAMERCRALLAQPSEGKRIDR